MNKDFLIWLIIVGFLIAGTGTGIYIMARGIRNNNPGNIRRSADAWRGLSSEQLDPEYFTFVAPVYGIRAMARILRNYESRYGLNTVEGIISRWAPPNENITGAYVKHVAEKLNIDPRTQFTVSSKLHELIKAIILHENGMQPYQDETIKEGISLA